MAKPHYHLHGLEKIWHGAPIGDVKTLATYSSKDAAFTGLRRYRDNVLNHCNKRHTGLRHHCYNGAISHGTLYFADNHGPHIVRITICDREECSNA